MSPSGSLHSAVKISMLNQELISLTDSTRWKDALKDLPHGPAHTLDYNRALHPCHEGDVFLYHAWNQRTGFKTACPIKQRFYKGFVDITTPYGLSGFTTRGHDPLFEREWMKFAQAQDWVCAYLMQNPYFSPPFPLAHTGRSFYFLPLDNPQEKLWQSISPTYRYDIRKAQLRGNLITSSMPGGLEKLSENLPFLWDQFLARTKTNALYHYTPQTLKRLMALPHAYSAGIEDNSKLVIISLFLNKGPQVDYFLSAGTDQGRSFSKLLIWTAITHFHTPFQKKQLNLGAGIDEEDSLSDFKKRFGGNKHPLPLYKTIFRPDIYRVLSQKMPPTPYFPAYLQPYLDETIDLADSFSS